MSELEDLIRRIEGEKATGVNPVVMDAVLFLLRQQRLVAPIDAIARSYQFGTPSAVERGGDV